MTGHYYIGLMSGTSVDSLDAALVDFRQKKPAVLGIYSQAVPQTIKTAVQQLAISGDNEIEQLRLLDKAIAQLSCDAVFALCKKSNHSLSSIAAIGSHGQTIRHYPQDQLANGYSLQVGDPNIIAENTGITTIADFRRRDIAAGGHGAPLAPAFHQAAFHSEQYNRIIVNTGGIANISYLPKQGEVMGYDTGPANGLMDSWCQKHQQQPYDKNGEWAASGKVNSELLSALLAHPFILEKPPKSTGRETFNLPWLEQQVATMKESVSTTDVQSTLLAFTAESIARHIQQQDPKADTKVYMCGGGAHNIELMKVLSELISPRPLETTDKLGIHPDWVEAVAFAWLAKQTLTHRPSNIPSVTGAKRRTILGAIYLA